MVQGNPRDAKGDFVADFPFLSVFNRCTGCKLIEWLHDGCLSDTVGVDMAASCGWLRRFGDRSATVSS